VREGEVETVMRHPGQFLFSWEVSTCEKFVQDRSMEEKFCTHDQKNVRQW